MPRKPLEFESHPMSFADAQAAGRTRGFCRYVVDGDTFDAFLDLGFLEYGYETLRLHDLDTPEIFHPKSDAERTLGLAAKGRVSELLLGKPILVQSYKDTETFGRFVADVWYYVAGPNLWLPLAALLVAEHLTKADVP